jgi:hypothetical protein
MLSMGRSSSAGSRHRPLKVLAATRDNPHQRRTITRLPPSRHSGNADDRVKAALELELRDTLHTLTWIVGSSLAMSAIAWVGLVSVALNREQLKKLLLPLVAFSAGSLLGGALLHLLPEAVAANGPGLGTFLPALGGFTLSF